MLTVSCGSAFSASRPAARYGIAAMMAVAAILTAVSRWSPAQAGAIEAGGCVGTWHAFNCATQWGPAVDPFVRIVPQPFNAAAQARAIARDRRWLARCKPVAARDRYGVARYRYAAPGCEFGVDAD